MKEEIENNLCGLSPKDFEKEIDGKATALYILKNTKGHEVAITNYGGTITDAKNEISDLAMAIAGKVVGHALEGADQASLIDGFIRELGDEA